MSRWAILISLLIAACGVTVGSGGRENVGQDPTSLEDVSGLGGASWEPLTAEEAAARSEIAVQGVVENVAKSRLNTADGLFPTAEVIESQGGLAELTALTDLQMTVTEVLAGGLPDVVVAAGEDLTITLGGGLYETVLTPEQASALGMVVVVETSFPEHEHGEEGPPDTETEVAVSADETFLWGHSPEYLNLAEADTVVLFLTEAEVPGFGGSPAISIVAPVHPTVVLRPSANGGWVDEFGDGAPDLETLLPLVRDP